MKIRAERPLILLAAALLVTVLPGVPADAARNRSDGDAWFENHWIDLTVDWEEATACDVSAERTVCFRTEAAMDTFVRQRSVAVAPSAAVICGSFLRLYNDTSYGGNVLSLSTRGVILNLATYGFDNAASSYRMGSCSGDFYAGASLSGSRYPGNTAAFAKSATMLGGWNNVVSSVIIG